jgi:hypothetical protein
MRLRSVALLLVAILAKSSVAYAEEAATGAEQVGTISGHVLDKSTGEPLIDAGVEVVDGGKATRTDIDGKYVIRVAPGAYQIRVFAPGFQGVRLQNISVTPGQVSKADAVLAPSGQAGGLVVEVVAQASKAAETTQLLKRKKASVVSETISSEAFKKTGASDAADIVKQAPAVTVKDDKYIQVRGLTERYASALLNGSRLPSTNPERRVVPLDLFPSGFLDSLSIVKSYTPDLPGDFSGGLALLEMKDFPETLTYSVGTSTGANTQSTFQNFNTYRGSKYDFLGYGEWFRGIPKGTPDSLKEVDSESARAAYGRRFRDIWAVDGTTAPPNFGVNGSIGNTWGPLGVEVAATYDNGYKHRRREISNQFTASSGDINNADVAPRDALLYNRSDFYTKLGAVLSSALKVTDDNKLFFRALYNRNGENEVLNASGYRTNDQSSLITQSVFTYTAEELDWGQLGGEHKWSWGNLDWRSAYARSLQDQPDQRYFTRVNGLFTVDSKGGLRLFDHLNEKQTDSAVDLTIPFASTGLPVTPVWTGLPGKFKAGLAYAYRDRDFTQRKFRYAAPGGTDGSDFFDPADPAEVILQPSHIGPGGFDFIETTEPRDSYTITQEIAAAYGMFEIPIIKDQLRFIGGLRYEYSYIQLNTFDDQGMPAKVLKNNSDPLPGANLVLSPRDDMNVRLGWSQSVSRPDFRELSPTLYFAPLGELEVRGNPFLVETHLESYDLRWEWFFSPAELVSASVFFKTLDKPIEETLVPSSSNSLQTWANGKDGQILGIECEARKNFRFIAPRFEYLTFLVNGTWADSEVNVPRETVPGLKDVQFINTNEHRALQGQAPFIVNAALDWTHPRWGTARLQYNTAGAKIALVGSNGLPDVMEQRRDQLDFVLIAPLKEYLNNLPLTATLAVENILNDQLTWNLGKGVSAGESNTSGKILDRPGVREGIMKRYTTGVGIKLGLSLSF